MNSQTWVTRGLFFLEIFVGLGAWIGGFALVALPTGAILHLPMDFLQGTPFHDYLVPGVILFFVVGCSNVVAAWLLLRRRPSAALAGIIAGCIQIGWMIGEIALIGYRGSVQGAYLLLGVLTLILALLLWRRQRSAG